MKIPQITGDKNRSSGKKKQKTFLFLRRIHFIVEIFTKKYLSPFPLIKK